MLIRLDDISKEVAKELGVNEYILKEVNRSQWKLLHEKMQDGNMDPVKILYVGKFSKKLRKDSNAIRANIRRIQELNISKQGD